MKTFITFLIACLVTLTSMDAGQVVVSYSGDIQIRELTAGKPYLTNRKYLLKNVPKELKGKRFTLLPGGAYKPISAKIPQNTKVYIALDSEKKSEVSDAIRKYSSSLEKDGWKYFAKLRVTDARMENMRVLTKTFHKEEIVEFKGIGFVGTIIISTDLTATPQK